MSYEHESMSIDDAMRLLDDAYNEVTFKNALVCVLDWCNWHHCAYIHKNVRIGVNQDGYIVTKYTAVKTSERYTQSQDREVVSGKVYSELRGKKYYVVTPSGGEDPKALNWYEYVNPSEENWYEKSTSTMEYVLIASSKLSYYDNPKKNKWYEYDQNEEQYVLSNDTHAIGTYVPVTPNLGDSPRDNGWYILSGGNYIPSNDNNVQSGTTYYICNYKSYYKGVARKETTYFPTEDTTVDLNKPYYRYTDDTAITKDLPDYTYKYERNVGITVPGVYDEVTLNNKRPAR